MSIETSCSCFIWVAFKTIRPTLTIVQYCTRYVLYKMRSATEKCLETDIFRCSSLDYLDYSLHWLSSHTRWCLLFIHAPMNFPLLPSLPVFHVWKEKSFPVALALRWLRSHQELRVTLHSSQAYPVEKMDNNPL